MSGRFLDEGELADLLRWGMQQTGVTGAAVAFFADGLECAAYAGLADAEGDLPVLPDTRFQIASVTKPMVATVIVRLADQGRLSLDDPVSLHVPELAGTSWGDQVSVRHLLANTGGVPLSAAVEASFPADGDDCLARLAATLAGQQPMFAPGSWWSYANAGWSLLGRVIETICGTTWESAMQSELFRPAGLRETGFIDVGDPFPAAACYQAAGGPPARLAPWRARALGPAGATVWATVTDLIKFARLHLRDGHLGGHYTSQGALAAMRTPHWDLRIPDFMDGWCLGWARWDWPGGPLWGWAGISEGHRTVLKILPHNDAALAIVTNSSQGRALYRTVFPVLLQRLGVQMPPFDRTPRPGAVDLHRYAGSYRWPDGGFDIRVTGDKLHIQATDETLEATPIDERVFVARPTDPDIPVLVFDKFDPSGRPHMLYDGPWAYPRLA
jgi:CubicO group peptidase (beta-lactamase class C family)